MPRILYVQYTNPAAYPPLHHSATILAEAGWDVLFVGIGARGAARLVLPDHPRIRYKQILKASGGAFGAAKYTSFVARVQLEALQFRPDWCYASDVQGAPPALAIRPFSGARVLYHEHDAPQRADVVMSARNQLARTADIVVAPAAARLALLPTGARKRYIVWNCPRASEVAAMPPRVEHAPFRLVYSGSLSRDRLTPHIIDAMKQLPNHVELHFFGYETAGHPGYAGELLARAEQAGLNGRVQYRGVIPARADLLAQLPGYDLGIATVVRDADPNLASLAGASNKPFEYLGAGLPLLVSDDLEWVKLFAEPGYAATCNPTDAVSIANALKRFVGDRDYGRAMGAAGRARVLLEWNYEKQFAPVLDALQS